VTNTVPSARPNELSRNRTKPSPPSLVGLSTRSYASVESSPSETMTDPGDSITVERSRIDSSTM
jgi:hypothetical protein